MTSFAFRNRGSVHRSTDTSKVVTLRDAVAELGGVTHLPLKTVDLSDPDLPTEFAAKIAPRVDGDGRFSMVGGTAYEQGYWAPSIRHHNGTTFVEG